MNSGFKFFLVCLVIVLSFFFRRALLAVGVSQMNTSINVVVIIINIYSSSSTVVPNPALHSSVKHCVNA